jgi:nitrite reductase/ring-hydroxylating ferredoxin subunit
MKSVIIVLVAIMLFSFDQDPIIPMVNFPDEVINLRMPEYVSIRADGGYVLLNHLGVKGVILYRESATSYHAYERNCPYKANEKNARVDVHSSNLYLEDPSCKSTFNFSDGQNTGGPAYLPLRQYHTDVTGNTLTITSEIVY